MRRLYQFRRIIRLHVYDAAAALLVRCGIIIV
jgi:hypothetical protein